MANIYQQDATARGYTVLVFVEAGASDLEGWVKPGTDYDDEFRMVCSYTGETLKVLGWNCLVEEMEDA